MFDKKRFSLHCFEHCNNDETEILFNEDSMEFFGTNVWPLLLNVIWDSNFCVWTIE
jgi:hypothetical protein